MTRHRRRQTRTQGARIALLFGRPRTPYDGDLGPSFAVTRRVTGH